MSDDGALIVRGGLPVSAGGIGAASCDRGPSGDRDGVPAVFGVVGESRRVRRGVALIERVEGGSMERRPPIRAHPRQDRQPRQLVTESKRALDLRQHAGVHGRLDVDRVGAEQLGEPPLHARRLDRDDVDRRVDARREP